MAIRIIEGDCLASLASLPAASVQCCVTSPPYYGLRDYGMAGQIGLEATPDEYVARMVDVFREVRRVLRDDGTLWLNIGDSYSAAQTNNGGCSPRSTLGGGGGKYRSGSKNAAAYAANETRRRADGAKPKDLLGIPWMLAFALRAPDYLGNIRREADRAWLAALVDGEGCITCLETKSPHGSGASYPPILQIRMCDIECIEHAAKITGYGAVSPLQEPPSKGGARGSYQWRLNGRKAADTIAEIFPFLLVKRKQAVVAWNLQALRDTYEAKRGSAMPSGLAEKQAQCRTIIQALNQRQAVDIPSWMVEPKQPVGPGWYLRSDVIWSKPNPMPESVTDRPTSAHEHVFLLSKAARYFYDANAISEEFAGVPYEGKANGAIVNGDRKDKGRTIGMTTERRNARNVWTIATQPYSGAHFATMPPDLAERCIKAGTKPGDHVLDPFGGAGTTGLVADRLGRNATLCELNPAYADLARDRIRSDGPLLAVVA